MFSGSSGIVALVWPWNACVMGLFSLWLLGLAFIWKDHALIVWLAGVPMALASVLALCLLSMVAGIFPQDGEAAAGWLRTFGFGHVFNSWAFVLIYLLLLTNLGLAVIRKIIFWKRDKNAFRFTLKHGGLWICLAGAFFGSGDVLRWKMILKEGDESSRAVEPASGQIYEMPFSLCLKNFKMEEYVPSGFFKESAAGVSAMRRGEQMLEIREGAKGHWRDWIVRVEYFYPHAEYLPMGFQNDAAPDSARPPAAFVVVEKKGALQSFSGWVSCGGGTLPPHTLPLSDGLEWVMASPRPKRFLSEVQVVQTKGGQTFSAGIEVNKPLSVAGWKLYQLSYDEQQGAASEYSVIEAVRDPWLPVVYGGLFMLLAGTFLFLSDGIRSMRTHDQQNGGTT